MAHRPCRELLQIICLASEQAAVLAREFRADPTLADLLVQRKQDKCVNGAVFQDVKTLADVLIQESVRKHIAQHFPEMSEHVVGEESALFRTSTGKEHTLRVCDTREETQALLEDILCDGLEEDAGLALSKRVAVVLAEVIHAPSELHLEFPEMTATFEPAHTGVWIDPIDCTSSFVKGRCFLPTPFNPILDTDSLPAVTVLIGAFDRRTGRPLLGVVNQPFNAFAPAPIPAASFAPSRSLGATALHTESLSPPPQRAGRKISSQPTRQHSMLQSDAARWEGRLVWGVTTAAESHWGQSAPPVRVAPDLLDEKPMLVHSKKEKSDVLASLSKDYTLCPAPGAGYKMLCVIDGIAQALATSSDSTYTWDTCGPHAILLAQGAVVGQFGHEGDIQYHRGDHTRGEEKIWAHRHGLLIARTREAFDSLRSVAAQFRD
eukprot:m.63157 g.63157  ORF g.63157 m.63157 type:complete len:434 (+) comp12453_c0_seq2:402-1703(+)